ncbi:MAG: glycosyl hydrolase [Paucibacter sp.]|nr:glycosyl hydrolase [Roseateles sp.]
MKKFALFVAAALIAGGALAGSDPLETPARLSELASARPITALARAGSGVVAVGQRGHILRSVDGGRRWTQSKVPTSSDLTAVQFPDARTGFATGHDGVVLKSEDGGATWIKLLDGRAVNRLVLEQMQARVDAGGTEHDKRLLDEAKRNAEMGPDKPFLDLWFTNDREGFVIGAYNLILHTADGGRSWQSWFDRTDNPRFLNFYAIRSVGRSLYIAGEAGLLLKLDGEHFKALASPYNGSFFGLAGTSAGVLVFGMRGNAYLSRDEGGTWRAVPTGLMASITAGDALPDGRVALVDQAGLLTVSKDGGERFLRSGPPAPMSLSAVVFAGDALVIGGVRGARALDLKKEP